jgi:hypothetical protein
VPREQNRLFPGHGKERLGTGVSRALVARGHPFLAPAVRAMTQVPGSAGYTLSSPILTLPPSFPPPEIHGNTLYTP